MNTAAITVRRARLEEAGPLTELVLRSKASWGYSAEFMARCREELRITPAKLTALAVWVAVVNELLAGMIALRINPAARTAEIEDFFVEPAVRGRGIGTALAAEGLATCRLEGVRWVSVDADPNAEAIYRRLGFHSTGYSASNSVPGRKLPRMQMCLIDP